MIPIKPAYHDYVQHMWRLYIRHGGHRPEQADAVALANWAACDAVSSTVTADELRTVTDFLNENYTSDWKTVRKLFRMTAEQRGLCRRQKEGQ